MACYLILYHPAPWSRVIRETLTGNELVMKFSACYGNQFFVKFLITARHLCLFWAKINLLHAIQNCLRFVLILSFSLFLDMQRQLLPSCTTATCFLTHAFHMPYKFYHWYLVGSKVDKTARDVMALRTTKVAKCYLHSCGAATQRGPWLPHSWGF